MEFLNALGFNFKMVFMQAVGFLLLLFLLKKFLFGKIKDIIKARSDEIKETYKKSEDDRAEAENLKEEYQKKSLEADKEAEGKIQAAVESAKKYSNEIIKKGQEKVAEETVKWYSASYSGIPCAAWPLSSRRKSRPVWLLCPPCRYT